MNGLKLGVISVLVGVLVTLLTGYVGTQQLIGASWYGFPATWLVYRVLAPQYSPWFVNSMGFVVDIVLWSVVAWLVIRGFLPSSPVGTKSKTSRRRSR